LFIRLRYWGARFTDALKETYNHGTIAEEALQQTLRLFISEGIISVYGFEKIDRLSLLDR